MEKFDNPTSRYFMAKIEPIDHHLGDSIVTGSFRGLKVTAKDKSITLSADSVQDIFKNIDSKDYEVKYITEEVFTSYVKHTFLSLTDLVNAQLKGMSKIKSSPIKTFDA